MRGGTDSLTAREKKVFASMLLITKAMTGSLANSWTSVGNAQYLSMLISALISILLAFIVYYICKKADAPFFAAAEKYIGGIFSKLYALILIVTLILSARSVAYLLSSTVVSVSLTKARLSVVSLSAIGASIIVAVLGIKAVCRFSMLVLPLALISLIMTLIMSLDSADIHHLFPILGSGPIDIVMLSLTSSSDFFLILLLGEMYDPNKGQKDNKKLLIYPPIIAGIISTGLYLINTLVFPYTFTQLSPLYGIISVVGVSKSFKALGSLFSFIWNTVFLITLCAHFCFLGHLSSKVLSVFSKKEGIPIFIFGFILLVLTLSDMRSFPKFLSFLFEAPKTLPLFVYSPLIPILILSAIRSKGAKDESG